MHQVGHYLDTPIYIGCLLKKNTIIKSIIIALFVFFLYKCRYVYIFYWKNILFIRKIINPADFVIILYQRSFKFYIITISISYIILIFYTCKDFPPIIFVTWKKNKNRGPLFSTFSWNNSFSWTIISTKIIIRQ